VPIYRLIEELVFPPPEYADPSGLLAVGGDLSPDRLLEAYRVGIFPWYAQDQPILWWSPDPRCVLELDEFKVSRSLRRTLQKGTFKVTLDRAFEEVIRACAAARREGQAGTWITPEMCEAYVRLHGLGFAHSVESWFEGALVGGLYGVSLGRVFFGESMFHHKTDASKVALATLVEKLKGWGFTFIDAQMSTEHIIRLGAKELPRRVFLKRLQAALRYPTKRWKWRV
jgi:leucyl/phenylalanyl-tRNA--protein transferase